MSVSRWYLGACDRGSIFHLGSPIYAHIPWLHSCEIGMYAALVHRISCKCGKSTFKFRNSSILYHLKHIISMPTIFFPTRIVLMGLPYRYSAAKTLTSILIWYHVVILADPYLAQTEQDLGWPRSNTLFVIISLAPNNLELLFDVSWWYWNFWGAITKKSIARLGSSASQSSADIMIYVMKTLALLSSYDCSLKLSLVLTGCLQI